MNIKLAREARTMDQTKYVLSYGAGVNSTAMIFDLLNRKEPIDGVVFADVGAELPQTYETVKQMARFLKKKSIPFTTVYPANNRTLEQRCLDRKVIPDRIRRWCTRDVKITPIFKFYRSLNAKIVQYIGIDAGEKKRVRPDPKDWIHNSYPLVENNYNREACIQIIKDEKFPVPVKSGCYFCIYSNSERLFSLWKNEPVLFQRAMEMEEANKHFPRQTLYPKMPLREMVEHFRQGKIPQ